MSDSQIYIDHDGRRWIVTEILRTRAVASIDGPGIEHAVLRFESEGEERFAREDSAAGETTRTPDRLQRLFTAARRVNGS